jgi:hypothetical protein
MPSTRDDSPASISLSSPGSAAPGSPGKTASHRVPGRAGDRWLVDYLTGRMVEAGIDVTVAAPLAADVQPDISAAFSTLARLDRACDPFGAMNP